MIITPHIIATRARREVMACGCPVVSFGSDLMSFTKDMEAALSIKRQSVRVKAEVLFDPSRTAREFKSVIDGVAVQIKRIAS